MEPFTVPKTFLAMTFLSPLAGTTQVSCARAAILGVSSAGGGDGVLRGRWGGQLLGLGLPARGGDGGWGRLRQGAMETRLAVGLLRAIRGPLSTPATGQILRWQT